MNSRFVKVQVSVVIKYIVCYLNPETCNLCISSLISAHEIQQ